MTMIEAARTSTPGATSRRRPVAASVERVESTSEHPARTAKSAEARPEKIAANVGMPASSVSG